MPADDIANDRRQEALDYHEFLKPGKLEIRATKPMDTGRESVECLFPGVARSLSEIEKILTYCVTRRNQTLSR